MEKDVDIPINSPHSLPQDSLCVSRELLWAPMEQIVAFGLPTLLTLHKASERHCFYSQNFNLQSVGYFNYCNEVSVQVNREVSNLASGKAHGLAENSLEPCAT